MVEIAHCLLQAQRKLPVPSDGVEVSLNPEELDFTDSRGLERKYEEQLRKQNKVRQDNEEDFSDLVAEHSAKQNVSYSWCSDNCKPMLYLCPSSEKAKGPRTEVLVVGQKEIQGLQVLSGCLSLVGLCAVTWLRVISVDSAIFASPMGGWAFECNLLSRDKVISQRSAGELWQIDHSGSLFGWRLSSFISFPPLTTRIPLPSLVHVGRDSCPRVS